MQCYGQDMLNLAQTQQKSTHAFFQSAIFGTPQGKGSLSTESQFSNYTNPWLFSNPNFSRIRFDYNLDISNLPFIVEAYVTNENNLIYRGNSFRIMFDSKKYKQRVKKKLHDSFPELAQLEEISLKGNPKDWIGSKILNLKNEAQNIRQITNSHLDIVKAKEKLTPPNSDSLTKMPDSSITKSIDKEKKIIYKLNYEYKKIEKAIDSFEKLETRLKSLSTQAKKADKFSDSLESIDRKAKAFDRESIYDRAFSDKISKNSISKFFYNVRDLNVGQIVPYYSPLTLSGLPMRGVNMNYAFRSLNFETVGGATMTNPLMVYRILPGVPKYDAWLYGEKVSFRYKDNIYSYTFINGTSVDNTYIYISGLRLPAFNFNYFANALSIRYTLAKNVLFEGEGSRLSNKSTSFSNNEVISPQMVFLSSVAYEGKLTYKPLENTEFRARVRQVNPGYLSLSTPMLLNDVREYELGYRQKLFTNRIIGDVNSKLVRDNLLNLKPTTNEIKGMGITLQTMFNRIPNLLISYQPYQQGNQHPDPLLRLYSQSKMFFGSVSYFHGTKKIKNNICFTYNQSNVILQGINLSTDFKYQIFTMSTVSAINSRFTISSNLSYGYSGKHLDSFNTRGYNIDLSFKVTPSLMPFIKSAYYQTLPGAYQLINSTGLSYALKSRLRFKLEGSYGKLRNMWNYRDKNLFSLNIKTDYFF
jgi:hypothetical protein